MPVRRRSASARSAPGWNGRRSSSRASLRRGPRRASCRRLPASRGAGSPPGSGARPRRRRRRRAGGRPARFACCRGSTGQEPRRGGSCRAPPPVSRRPRAAQSGPGRSAERARRPPPSPGSREPRSARLALTLARPRSYNRPFRSARTPSRISFATRSQVLPSGESTMEAMKTKLVDYRVKNGVAWIELVDPPANTYTYEMMRDLDDAILQARFDENVHVIVLRGAGEKFFCAGANINMLKTVNPTFKYYFCLHANETLNRLEQTPKLVIAALNGHTVGGGLEIAMAADIRIARKGAGKVGLPEVSLGVLPGTGGTQRLARLINKSTAI